MRLVSRATLAVAAVILSVGAAPMPDLRLSTAVPILDATLNGTPVRLRLALDGPGLVALSPDAAARLGLRATDGSLVVVGPVHLSGRSSAARLSVAGASGTVRVIWNARSPDEAGVDGQVGPGALPVASLRLLGTGAGGRRTTLSVRAVATAGLAGTLRLGGEQVEIMLAPDRPETIATAAAGALLARTRGGRLDPVEPAVRRIGWGVDRPVRLLTLGRPLPVAGLTLGRLLVRTGDYAGPGHMMPAGGPDEIVVTARGDRPRYRLVLGRDLLGRCASITWIRASGRLLLDCP